MSTIPEMYSYTHVISASRVDDVMATARLALINAGFPQIDWVDDFLWPEIAKFLLYADLLRRMDELGFEYGFDKTQCTYDAEDTISIRLEFGDELAPVLFRTFVI